MPLVENRGGSSDMLKGPLGLWPFPLLNVLLAFLSKAKGGSSSRSLRLIEFVRDGEGRIIQILEREASG